MIASFIDSATASSSVAYPLHVFEAHLLVASILSTGIVPRIEFGPDEDYGSSNREIHAFLASGLDEVLVEHREGVEDVVADGPASRTLALSKLGSANARNVGDVAIALLPPLAQSGCFENGRIHIDRR